MNKQFNVSGDLWDNCYRFRYVRVWNFIIFYKYILSMKYLNILLIFIITIISVL